MNIQSDISEIETALASNGVSMGDFLKSVGIHRATWDRWKSGTTLPQMRTWTRVDREAKARGLKPA